MSAHSILGVAADAELVEIKRAYARLLKLTRPDDDADAFQRLQAAYERCVAIAKRKLSSEAEPDSLAPAPIEIEQRSPRPVQKFAAPARPVRRAIPALEVADLHTLLEEMVKVGEEAGPVKLHAWLMANDDLLSLDTQHAVADALPGFLVWRKPNFESRCLEVILGFFNLGSTHGPDVNADGHLHQAWAQVRSNEEFSERLAALRRRRGGDIDLLIFRELTSAPSAWRRRFLCLLPGMPGQVRRRLIELLALDQQRAMQLVNPDAGEFWMALSDPTRISLHACSLVLIQAFLIVGPTVGGLMALADLGLIDWLTMTLMAVFGISIVWLVLRTLDIGHQRFQHWRAKKAGKLAKGATRDSVVVTTTVLALISLGLCGFQVLISENGNRDSMITVCGSLLAGLVLIIGGKRLRWEIGLFIASMTYCLSEIILGATGGALTNPTLLIGLASSGAIFLTIGVDALHARSERVEMSVARREFNGLALVVAIASWFLVMVFQPGQDHSLNAPAGSPSQAAASAPTVSYVAPIPVASIPAFAAPTPPEVVNKFASVALAFGTVRQAATPSEMPDSPYRAFHIATGPLAGDWHFSGGNRSGPTRFVHYPISASSYMLMADQSLCEASRKECDEFRRRTQYAPQELNGRSSDAGRLTWDSPSVAPRRYSCPPAKLAPEDARWVEQASVGVRVLFNARGGVLDAAVLRSSGDDIVDAVALASSRSCQITPAEPRGYPEGGILETVVRFEPTPPR